MNFLLWLASALIASVAAWDNAPLCGTSKYPDAGSPRQYDRIVGGWEVQENELPYQTTLRTSTGSFFCGGSVITANAVLTAAHCTAGRDAAGLRVGVEEHNRLNSGRIIAVSVLHQHENYDSGLTANDISLLIVPTQTFSDSLKAVCTPTKTASGNADGYEGDRLIVSGWGTLSEGGATATTLRAVDVFGYTLAQCRASGYPAGFLLDGMNCAGVDEGGRDACQGDSGGPLVWKNTATDTFEEVGIVSWGRGCAVPNFPGVYADVIYYEAWINDKQ